MLTQASARRLLEPFRLELTEPQIDQMLTYLDLLLHWNRKINLTAIRSPEECVTRHFGESLYLSRFVAPQGRLLDIGSGAGFPGLALKIVWPQLPVTLLEPTTKKRAFLKEVARVCRMEGVEVRPERLEQFARERSHPLFETATARAVGSFDQLLPQASQCLKPQGRLCLWVSHRQLASLSGASSLINWLPPIPLPLCREREIWVGTRID
jgi:16S rRNA (guanine527-N7)-methyltransferase